MKKISESFSNNKFVSFLILAFFFILPFERIPTFELAGFTVKISYILGLLIVGSIIFSQPWQIFKKHPLLASDYLLISFWVVSFISSFFTSPDLSRSLVISGLWLFVILLYLFLSRLTLSKKIFDIILISSVAVSIFGLFQFIGDTFGLSVNLTGLREAYTKTILGFPRIQSVALEPLYFANFLLVPFFVSTGRYIEHKSFFNKYFWITVLILINIVLTVSRGAYIALAFSFVLFLIYLLVNKPKNIGRKLLGLVLVVFMSVTASYGLISINGKTAGQNFSDHSLVEDVSEDGSAMDRLNTYETAYRQFLDKPIFGNGVASFGVLTKDSEGSFENEGYGTVNNEYLEILSETGAVGFGLFVLFLIFFVKELVVKYSGEKSKYFMNIAVLFGIIAILIQYNFFSTLYIIYIWAFLAIARGGLKGNVTV